jgi:hypothetical protein
MDHRQPTVIVPIKGTFKWISASVWNSKNGYEDFWGFFAPSNIRLGFNYVPIKTPVGLSLQKQI